MPDPWPGLREVLLTAAEKGTGRDPVKPEAEAVPVKATGLAGGPRNGAPPPRRNFTAEASAALRAQVRAARTRRRDAAD